MRVYRGEKENTERYTARKWFTDDIGYARQYGDKITERRIDENEILFLEIDCTQTLSLEEWNELLAPYGIELETNFGLQTLWEINDESDILPGQSFGWFEGNVSTFGLIE